MMNTDQAKEQGFSFVENFNERMNASAERCMSRALPWLSPSEYPIVTSVLKESSGVPGVANIKVIALKPYSNHPEDYYLRVVLAETDSHYVVWEENTQDTARCGHPAYFCGSYFDKTIAGMGEAIVKFNEKGRGIVIGEDGNFDRKYANHKTLADYDDSDLSDELKRRGYDVFYDADE